QQARDELRPPGVQGREAAQVEVAQVEDEQAAGLGPVGLGDRAPGVAGLARLDVQLGQPAGLEVPEDLELQGGPAGTLPAAAAFEEAGQLAGQGDGGGVADEDGGEPLEEGGTSRPVGGDGLAQGALEGPAEEVDEGLAGGEALLDGGLGQAE